MPRSVLLADDSLTIQKAVQWSLAHEDVALSFARSGEEALAKARELRPDLVVADSVMPGRNGYELAAALRADPSFARTPVLLLASNQEPLDEARWDVRFGAHFLFHLDLHGGTPNVAYVRPPTPDVHDGELRPPPAHRP